MKNELRFLLAIFLCFSCSDLFWMLAVSLPCSPWSASKVFFYGKKKKHMVFIIMKKDFFLYGVLIWYKNIISKLFNNSSQIKPTGASIITWLMIPSSYLSVSCYLQLNFSQKVFLFRNWHFFYEKTHYYIHHWSMDN